VSFYPSIAEVYNKIFPLNPEQVHFISRTFSQTETCSILDIGCGTGLLSQALSETFYRVVGIDLDEAMLDQARASNAGSDNLEFLHLDMLKIDRQFDQHSFDSLVCFGNTLVHLPSLDHVSSFFEKCFSILTSGGKLLIQMINYDRILDQNIDSLPTLDTDDITFIRNYNYLADQERIEFETILTIKKTQQIIRNKVRLLPLRKSEIKTSLRDAGFKHIQFFGNFKGDPLLVQSIPLVFEASKP